MKTTLLSITAAALMAASLPAFAESAGPADAFIPAQKMTEYLAKDRLIGANVKNKDGQIIGDIEDLIIDNDDRVAGVIMGVGGFLGIGEKKIAVKTSALDLEVTDGKMGVTMAAATKDALKAAPAYQRVMPQKGIFERIMSKGQEIKDKSSATAKDAVDAAKDKAGPAMENAKKQAGEAMDKAKQQAGEAMDKAKQQAGEAMDKAKEAAKSAAEKAKEAAKPADAKE